MESQLRLEDRYPSSPPCNCEICRNYCLRPGWWTIEQASNAIKEGYSNRMMLEIAPEFTFAVLSPAFRGCEGLIAIEEFSKVGCNFFINGLCELHGTNLQPLECKVCHHAQPGLGPKCHLDIERQWNTSEGQEVVVKWMEQTGFNDKLPNYTRDFNRNDPYHS
jgi:hypothetical protein